MKAIVLDIDGTLVNSNKEISDRTCIALLKAQEEGIKVILASARPLQGMLRYSKTLKLDKYGGALLSYNGSKIVTYGADFNIPEKNMSLELSQRILRHLENFDVVPIIDIGEYMYVNNVYEPIIEDFNVIEYEARNNGYLLRESTSLPDLLTEGLAKILVAGDPGYLSAHAEELVKPFAKEAIAAFSAPFYLEYTALGVDKAESLKSLLHHYDIDLKDTYAFGDGENDVSMIEIVGHGVAMGNGVDSLKKIADEITATNDQDGIALVVERKLKERGISL